MFARSKSFLFAIFSTLILGLAAAQPAHAVTLTFEGLADLEVVTNQYAAQDALFVNATAAVAPPGGTLNEIDFPPASGVTVVTNEVDTDGDTFPDSFGTIQIDFINNVYNVVSGAVTYSDLALSGDDLIIAIYLATDLVNPAATTNIVENLGTTASFGFLGFSNIARVILSGGAGSYFILDDFTYEGATPISGTPTAVPEPTTFFMISLSGLGLVAKRFKSKN